MTQEALTLDERRKIWLYFLDLRKRYALLVAFLGLVLVELALGKMLLLAGLLWLGGALALERQQPSDQEVDEWFSRELMSLVRRALQTFNPPEHEVRAPPLALYGPDTDERRDLHPLIRPRAGKEGGYRSPVNRAVILLPMQDQLGIFSCRHYSLDGVTSQISVEEHHYHDVVTVRLEEGIEVSAVPRDSSHRGGEAEAGRTRNPKTQVFSLEFTNGRRLCVPVSVTWQGELEVGAGLQPSLDKTVLAIRALMRDKR